MRMIINLMMVLLIPWCATVSLAQGPVRLNKAIELLESEQAAFGVLAFDYSMNNARSLSTSGLDFIIIDMEHAPFSVESLRDFLLGMIDKRVILEKGSLQPDVVPFVRIPAVGAANDTIAQVKQVLDVGVFGVMFPGINNRQEAESVVRAMRYPQDKGANDFHPEGIRGMNPSNATWFWGTRDYTSRADVWPLDPNGELLAIIQIESIAGLENIDEIASVPGVGVIFIGPADLSNAMGYASSAPEVELAIQSILASCLRHGVACAITTNENTVAQRLEQGFRFVTVGFDGGLSAQVTGALSKGKESVGR